jgi:hypothetical protein
VKFKNWPLKLGHVEESVPNTLAIFLSRDRCYDFKNIFAEKFSKKIGVFDSRQVSSFA